MRNKPKIICLIGIDGSGKTTLSKLLVDELRSQGIKSQYAYGRYRPQLSMPMISLGKFIFLRNADIKDYKNYSEIKRRALKKQSILASFYQVILLIDYAIQIFLKINMKKALGNTIVCDRYVYDTAIYDILRINTDFESIKKWIKICSYFAPNPDTTFLIDLPEDIAYKRKNDTPSIDYLKERRCLYLELARLNNMYVLDGTKSKEYLISYIKKVLG